MLQYFCVINASKASGIKRKIELFSFMMGGLILQVARPMDTL